MPNIFPQLVKVSPSFTEPELILTYAQATGAFEALPGGKPLVKLGEGDLAVYIHSLDLRSESVAGQAAGNLLPSASLVTEYFSTLTYLIRVRATWDHHDMQAASNYSVALPAAQDLACRQGIFQQMRNALLYGFNPANNEGLLNAQGATKVNLPPDSASNTTLTTYDNGEMALFWLNQIVLLKTGMLQSGRNISNRIVIITPQRVFLQMAYANIVDLVSYQRPGAGTSTTGEIIKKVVEEGGDSLEWYFDDTLIGQGTTGAGELQGADLCILTIPEIEQPTAPGINTNEFATLQPNKRAVNLMYADMAAPMKIPTPIPDGGITEVQELRITSGWNIRPEGLYIVSIPH
jgi:hypothetical protein